MLVTTKGRYAMRFMVRVAQAGKDGRVSLRQVSAEENISLKYLEQLVRPLMDAGLVRSVRGKGGGYTLARASKDISAGDVLRAAEGTTVPVDCLALGPDLVSCPRKDECTTVKFWAGLDEVIENYVDGISLDTLAKSAKS